MKGKMGRGKEATLNKLKSLSWYTMSKYNIDFVVSRYFLLPVSVCQFVENTVDPIYWILTPSKCPRPNLIWDEHLLMVARQFPPFEDMTIRLLFLYHTFIEDTSRSTQEKYTGISSQTLRYIVSEKENRLFL